jgi:hypothetical protein
MKINILKFQKIPKNNIPAVENKVFYGPANNQQEMVCIPAYTKNDKSRISSFSLFSTKIYIFVIFTHSTI